ncbi:MAG: endonuclease/exonuclease/phosphatase family protein [Burkholderiales bacterium]|nr:endonuclease/exonuclease/phosphatase family protein [Burkholderiales bacterium]
MSQARSWLSIAALPILAGCVALTVDPRALIYSPDGIAVRSLPCPAAAQAARAAVTVTPAMRALDPARIRLVTWNIHKQADAGWERDLARFAADYDVVLLQEVTLTDALGEILHAAGLRWVMASSFLYFDTDIGVLTASRAVPVANCTLRAVEPLILLPKSAVVSWLPIAGSTRTLAVANLHSINFSLSLETYEEQFAAVIEALATHDGPIVLAGDLNTWSDARLDAVRNAAARLRLTAIPFKEGRARFFGRELDHILVRGLEVVAARAFAVDSSDHNPVAAELRVVR